MVIPFLVWVALLFIQDRGKSIANVIEVFWLGCLLPLAAVIRVVVGQRVNRRVLAASLVVAFCFVAVLLWALVAPIPVDKS